MNFGELRFWILLSQGLVLILFGRAVLKRVWAEGTREYDKVALALLGLSMLLAVSWQTFLIFILVKITTYFGIQPILARPRQGRKWLWVLIPLQFLPLLYYKYSNFLLNQALGLNWNSLRDLIIPVGISFYTFQVVSFVVDTIVHQKPLPRFLDFINFVAFFPQLVAGPIERREDLLPQMRDFEFRFNPAAINEGSTWVALGLFFKCCLADNLAKCFDPTSFDNPYLIWKANLFFGLRIYFDFAGYSLVAVGLARCLGVRLTLNFRSPYCASSVVDFWRRWHITLSNWFRDYLYFPLGGGRVPWWAFNVALVFLVSGVWHGAGWNFIIWGLLHGCFLIGQRLAGKRVPPRFLGWLLTMILVFYAWLAFYETRTEILAKKFRAISNPFNYTLAGLTEQIRLVSDPNIFLGYSFLIFAVGILLLEGFSLRKTEEPYFHLRKPAVLCVLIVLTVWLAPGITNDFIYFAF